MVSICVLKIGLCFSLVIDLVAAFGQGLHTEIYHSFTVCCLLEERLIIENKMTFMQAQCFLLNFWVLNKLE